MPSTEPSARHTLLALCGLSPAVLTETIWALATENPDDPDPLPDRVVVLTTRAGHTKIINTLLTAPDTRTPSIWSQLRNALQEKKIPTEGKLRFGDTSEHIKTFTSTDPATGIDIPLDDIRTTADQTHCADFILEIIATLTARKSHRLTVSLAGGRKTMSALLYGSMTLLGRPDDRLTHVLVPPPYDSPRLDPPFFLPSQLHQTLTHPPLASGSSPTTHLAAEARIELANIPFVPLRTAFPDALTAHPHSFRTLVATYTGSAIRTSSLPSIHVFPAGPKLHIRISATDILLTPSIGSLLHFLLTHAHREQPPIPDYQNAIEPYSAHLQHLHDSAPAGDPTHWQHKINHLENIDNDTLRKRLHALSKKLSQAGPAGEILRQKLPERGRFSLLYPADKIHLNP